MVNFFKKKTDLQNPVIRKIQKFEKLIGKVLESDGLGTDGTTPPVDWHFNQLCFDESSNLKEIDLPDSLHDRQLLAFTVFSHFFDSGLFLTSPDQGSTRIVHGFFKGETFHMDIQPRWSLNSRHPLKIGDVYRLKSMDRLPVEVLSELEINDRHSIFLIRTGEFEYMLLTTLLAEPWLEDHVLAAQTHLTYWLKTL